MGGRPYIYIYNLEESPPLDKLSNHRMLSNLLTLPAESISKGTEKHDGVLTFLFNVLEALDNYFFLMILGSISFPGASRGCLEDQLGSQTDVLIIFRTPLRK